MHERLIGAIVLIVIAAIMVPLLMTHAHHPGRHLRDLTLAAEPMATVSSALALPPATAETGRETGRVIRVARASQSIPLPASSAFARMSALPAPKHIPMQRVAKLPAPKEAPVMQPATPPESAPVVAEEATPKPPTHAQDTSRQAASPQDSAPTRSAPADQQPLGQGVLHAGDWYVQVASFASHANAAQMAILLTRAGYHAFLSTNEPGGTLYYRVRVGPYASESRARAVAPGLSAISGSKVIVRQVDGSGE